jgi:hypothetical protein
MQLIMAACMDLVESEMSSCPMETNDCDDATLSCVHLNFPTDLVFTILCVKLQQGKHLHCRNVTEMT